MFSNIVESLVVEKWIIDDKTDLALNLITQRFSDMDDYELKKGGESTSPLLQYVYCF